MDYYHIDAFTSERFKGNSAGVVICTEHDIPDALKQSIASELKHSETAFVFISNNTVTLRWFTPIREVDLCGHATIAASHALWESRIFNKERPISFNTKSGILKAEFDHEKIELDFPQLFVSKCEPNSIVNQGLGIKPIYTGKNERRYLLEIEDPDVLRNIKPDFGLLKTADLGAFIVTSRSDRKDYDFLSRFFAPYVGIEEDPVTGSSHCYLAPYWSKKLGKNELIGFQESMRTGIVGCKVTEDNRVKLRGEAVTLFQANWKI